MSDSPSSLSVLRLLEELHQVTDWYMLGVYLELPREDLCEIESQFSAHGLKRCKTELFVLWLKSNRNASWELIAIALEKIGEKVLADEIRQRYLASASLPAVANQRLNQDDRSTITPVKLEKPLVRRFTKLEREFTFVVTDLKNSLEEKQIPIKKLQRFLKVRLEQDWECSEVTCIDDLFQQISPHYCFLNTTLLEDIIEKFVGEPLKQQLEMYEEHLDEFTSSTKMALLKEVPSHCLTSSDGMSLVVLKLTGRWLNVTIRRFQELANQIFGTMSNTLTHIRVEDDCICVSWFARKSAIPSLVALAQQKVEFLKLVDVLKLTVGDITILEQKEGEEVDSDLCQALLQATTACSVEAVEFLLTLGADPNCISGNGTTPLIIACKRGSVSIAKVLLKVHANPNMRNKSGETALMKGCDSNIDLVKLLLQSGAVVNEQTSRGHTALAYATRSGHSDIVQLLLEEGAAVNVQDSSGWTALMYACHDRHPGIVKILLDHTADPNIQDSMYNQPALNLVCLQQLTPAVENLLAHGADPNLQGAHGLTALRSACCHCDHPKDPSILFLLLSAGANPSAQDDNGLTALMSAASTGYQEGVEALLSANADVNAQTRLGYTALHFASDKGHLPITELLLAGGANTSLVDIRGQTALDLALDYNHHDVCQLLLMHMSSEPSLDIQEQSHQIQVQHLRVQPQIMSQSSRSSYQHSIQQIREALQHPLPPADTFKHWEHDEEEEMDSNIHDN